MSEYGPDEIDQDRAAGIGAAVGLLIERVEALDVRCLEQSARVVDINGQPPNKVTVTFSPEIEFGVDETSLLCTFAARVEFLHDDTLVAEASIKHALMHTLTPGPIPDAEPVTLYLERNGRFIIYPYQREAIQNAVSRIGLGELVLGVMRRDQPTLLSISMESPGPEAEREDGVVDSGRH